MNYIKTMNNKIAIYTKKSIKTYKVSFNNYINKVLLKDLTTLPGRIDAVKIKYHIYKLVPIYIDKDICLLPLFNLNSDINIYINVYQVLKTINDSNKTKIIFIDGEELYVNINTSTLKNKIKKVLSIMI